MDAGASLRALGAALALGSALAEGSAAKVVGASALTLAGARLAGAFLLPLF